MYVCMYDVSNLLQATKFTNTLRPPFPPVKSLELSQTWALFTTGTHFQNETIFSTDGEMDREKLLQNQKESGNI